MDVALEPTWKTALNPIFQSDSFLKLTQFVKQEYQQHQVFPAGRQIFSAFWHCPLPEVKVVILGQDPYHGEGQAHGLAFSVAAGVPFPPSLLNIFKELKTDLGIPMPAHGDLSRWASQGVFLLNATLTVRSNLAGSHQNQGWELFTDEVIRTISCERSQVVFLLWGAYAQKKEELIDAENKIKKSAQEEGKIRLKQMQDRKLLQRLENENLSDTEAIAKQNEKRADAIKAGKSTADIDKKISGLKTNIEGRSAQVTQLQTDLKTSAVGGGAKPEEVLQFSGESGQRSNFDGLSEGMKTKLLAAGQQYFEQTGQKLQMNSGARDPEDQKRLYDETVQAGRPGIGPTGMPVAPPGKSSHETGNAVDIQNYSDPKALAALGANGLRQTVPKDPVHFQLQAADGGVFSGPDEGYPAALHGEEAVIPLNNGGGNFVKVFEDMAMMMGKQVGAMDELIRIAKNSNDIQTKILRVQQSYR
jgi:uracil-DNA glycosylase